MNKRRQHLFFGAALLLIFVAIGFMVFQQERILRSGETVILETRPIDPRDLFRGEYVILRYSIERDDQVVEEALRLGSGNPIYIRLEKDEFGVGRVAEVSGEAPDSLTGLWLVGETRGSSARFPMLEQYYVPEGAGTPIERTADIHVEVSLKNGDARIMQLLDGSLEAINPADYIE